MTTDGRNASHGSTFVDRYGLLSDAQREAAQRMQSLIQENNLHTVRVCFPDLYGHSRGKSLLAHAFVKDAVKGIEMACAPFLLGSWDEILLDPFGAAPLGMPELSGFANMVVVPDPSTFRILPWAPGTGWVIADCYLKNGEPVPFAPRNVMRRALGELNQAGFDYTSGLEVEAYLFKVVDAGLRSGLGGPGQPPAPPEVEAVAHGYRYLAESHLDEIDSILSDLKSHLRGVGLPLRNIDDEWGPGQIEFVFDPISGLAGADAMFLFRSAAKQICQRLGYLVTFMCQPAIAGCYASGWHLHESLVDLDSRKNAFAPTVEGESLSAVGRHFVGGLLDHAPAASVFSTPTVNGYNRRKPFSLAPERATWGVDQKAAMVRVYDVPYNPSACHLENRIGEPGANPYLYMASEIVAGLDGIKNKVDPGPASTEPYAERTKRLLPKTLDEALTAVDQSEFFRAKFGDAFIDWMLLMKRGEVARYLKAGGGGDAVTDWEQREYFSLT